MGRIKDAKAQSLAVEAERAVVEGRVVFAARLNTPVTASNLSGSVSGWAEMIEAVEAAGWVLSQWAASDDPKGRPVGYALFRRS